MSRAAVARARLERLLEPAGEVFEALLSKTITAKGQCSTCGFEVEVEVPIPDKVALSAAIAIHDRAGVGPKSTITHETQPVHGPEAIAGLIQDLLCLPLDQREVLARSILPEYALASAGQQLTLPSTATGNPEGDSPSRPSA